MHTSWENRLHYSTIVTLGGIFPGSAVIYRVPERRNAWSRINSNRMVRAYNTPHILVADIQLMRKREQSETTCTPERYDSPGDSLNERKTVRLMFDSRETGKR
jgi:hypothetical protein